MAGVGGAQLTGWPNPKFWKLGWTGDETRDETGKLGLVKGKDTNSPLLYCFLGLLSHQVIAKISGLALQTEMSRAIITATVYYDGLINMP